MGFQLTQTRVIPRTFSRSYSHVGMKPIDFAGFRWSGNISKTLMLPRPLSYCESHKQNPAMVAEMDRLLDHYNYADVARILNENGFKTGDGLPLTSTAVGNVRKAYGLKSRFDRLRERGMLTMSEIARRCGVSTKTISEWRQRGRICARAINDRNQFLFENPGPNLPREHPRKGPRSNHSSTASFIQ